MVLGTAGVLARDDRLMDPRDVPRNPLTAGLSGVARPRVRWRAPHRTPAPLRAVPWRRARSERLPPSHLLAHRRRSPLSRGSPSASCRAPTRAASCARCAPGPSRSAPRRVPSPAPFGRRGRCACAQPRGGGHPPSVTHTRHMRRLGAPNASRAPPTQSDHGTFGPTSPGGSQPTSHNWACSAEEPVVAALKDIFSAHPSRRPLRRLPNP